MTPDHSHYIYAAYILCFGVLAVLTALSLHAGRKIRKDPGA